MLAGACLMPRCSRIAKCTSTKCCAHGAKDIRHATDHFRLIAFNVNFYDVGPRQVRHRISRNPLDCVAKRTLWNIHNNTQPSGRIDLSRAAANLSSWVGWCHKVRIRLKVGISPSLREIERATAVASKIMINPFVANNVVPSSLSAVREVRVPGTPALLHGHCSRFRPF